MAIALNLMFFLVLPAIYESNGATGLIAQIYDPTVGAGYAFYVNLFCSAALTFFFWKELVGIKYQFDKALLRRMFSYSWPILVLGIAGILNQTADKILFPYIYERSDAHTQLGIYGAASKIAMIMAMITQAFRYAYEPFVFGKSKDKDNRETYAQAMKFFIIFTLLAFLVVIGYLDVLKHIIGRDYWSGLRVVPIVMAAEIMMGVYFNLSFWYKLIDKTIWGAWFSGAGCAVLIAVNVRAAIRLYGVRMGWFCRLRNGYGAVVSCRSEEVSDKLSAQVDRRLRGYNGAVLLLHELRQRASAHLGSARSEHRARNNVRSAHHIS